MVDEAVDTSQINEVSTPSISVEAPKSPEQLNLGDKALQLFQEKVTPMFEGGKEIAQKLSEEVNKTWELAKTHPDGALAGLPIAVYLKAREGIETAVTNLAEKMKQPEFATQMAGAGFAGNFLEETLKANPDDIGNLAIKYGPPILGGVIFYQGGKIVDEAFHTGKLARVVCGGGGVLLGAALSKGFVTAAAMGQ